MATGRCAAARRGPRRTPPTQAKRKASPSRLGPIPPRRTPRRARRRRCAADVATRVRSALGPWRTGAAAVSAEWLAVAAAVRHLGDAGDCQPVAPRYVLRLAAPVALAPARRAVAARRVEQA